MILVVGGTGVLGQRVVRRLRAEGKAVRILTRQPGKAEGLRQLGVEVATGDLTEPGSVRSACTGVEQVVAAAHALLGRGRHASERVDDAGHRALIDAARQAQVRRFVYISILGASPEHPVDFWRTKHAVEQHLRASGLPHVILRPSAFMEVHAHQLIGKAILGGGAARLIGPGTKPRNFVAADDVAAVAVRALGDAYGDSAAIDLGGPSNLSNLEVAQRYAQACGVPLRVSHLPLGVATTLARLIKPLHPGVARVLSLFSLPPGEFNECFEAPSAIGGVALTTLEDFVTRRVAEARGPPSPRP